MKKVAVVLVVVLSLCLTVSLAFAAETKMGLVRSVDAKAGTVVVAIEGKDQTLKAGSGVDLGSVKEGMKVNVTIDGGVATKIEKKRSAPIGC